MSYSSGIIKSFRLKTDTILGGYRIKRVLGRGYECECYLAIEIPTEVKRALKIYPLQELDDLERVRHTARVFDRLACTGSVARYHHLSTGFLPANGKPAAMLVMELLRGETLDRHLKSIKGRRRQRESQYLRLLARIAEKIARIHRTGFAVGDLENPQNIIITPTGEPVYCDLEPGEVGDPNRDYENDLSELISLFDSIFSLKDRRELYREAKGILEEALEKPFRRDLLKRISKRLLAIAEFHDQG